MMIVKHVIILIVMFFANEAIAQFTPPGRSPITTKIIVDEPVILNAYKTFYYILPNGSELWYIYGQVGTVQIKPEVAVSWINANGDVMYERVSVFTMNAPYSGIWNWGTFIIIDRMTFPLLQIQSVRIDTDPCIWGPIYLYSDP